MLVKLALTKRITLYNEGLTEMGKTNTNTLNETDTQYSTHMCFWLNKNGLSLGRNVENYTFFSIENNPLCLSNSLFKKTNN